MGKVKLFNRLRSIFRKPFSKEEQKSLADFEMYEMKTQLIPLFYSNFIDILDNLEEKKSADVKLSDLAIASDYCSFELSNDLFLWGMVREFLKGRPLLPTGPEDRLQLHLMSYFMQRYKLPLDEARTRLATARDLAGERDNQIWQEMVNRGEATWRDKSTNIHLRAVYELSRALVRRTREN